MKLHFRQIILFAVFIITASTSFSQTELKNRIVDFTTYMPIEGASIYVQNTTIGTVSNVDGKFVLVVPQRYIQDTLVISSIGFKSYKTTVAEFENAEDIFLEEDIASLDEVLIVAETRPKTGNDIVLRAIEELEDNLPENAYLQKGFIRHKERNKKQYKWLVESAITLYDSSYAAGANKFLKLNVDQTRKSYDLRDVDSLFVYATYLKNYNGVDIRSKNLRRDTIATASLTKAIKWNDSRINGLENLFQGELNMIRNANKKKALLNQEVLTNHQFTLDTVLVENERKLYKIKISKSTNFVDLNIKNIYSKGFEPKGWMYVYWDNFAIKKIEYELVAASDIQKRRSKSLYDTLVNHKMVITYKEYQDKMYPNYIYYETPKLVNVGDRSSDAKREGTNNDKDEQFYYTIQEIVFTEIVQEPELVKEELNNKLWSADMFSPRPYNKEFWKNYNVLLESEEEEQLIEDLTRRAGLYKD